MTEAALAYLGLVVLLDALPIPLPNFRPFNCPLCKAGWVSLAVGWGFGLTGLELIQTLGLTCLGAGLLTIYCPLIWRQFPGPSALREESDASSHAAKGSVTNAGDTGGVREAVTGDDGWQIHG